MQAHKALKNEASERSLSNHIQQAIKLLKLAGKRANEEACKQCGQTLEQPSMHSNSCAIKFEVIMLPGGLHRESPFAHACCAASPLIDFAPMPCTRPRFVWRSQAKRTTPLPIRALAPRARVSRLFLASARGVARHTRPARAEVLLAWGGFADGPLDSSAQSRVMRVWASAPTLAGAGASRRCGSGEFRQQRSTMVSDCGIVIALVQILMHDLALVLWIESQVVALCCVVPKSQVLGRVGAQLEVEGRVCAERPSATACPVAHVLSNSLW